MMWGYDWGWGAWLVMSMMMVLFWGLVIAGIVVLVRYLAGGRQGGPPAVDRGQASAEELLTSGSPAERSTPTTTPAGARRCGWAGEAEAPAQPAGAGRDAGRARAGRRLHGRAGRRQRRLRWHRGTGTRAPTGWAATATAAPPRRWPARWSTLA
jgi:putative membrane protein